MGIRIVKIGLLLSLAWNAYAIDWWKTRDQKGYIAYQKKQYQKAITFFKRPDWRGVAAFRQKNYTEAIRSFAEMTTPDGFYNLGTALAFQGDYENAIKAYQKVLSINPQHQDAKYNLAILEKMQQDQKKQHQSNHQNQNQQQEQKEKQHNSKDKEQDKNQGQDKQQKNNQESTSQKQQMQGKEKKNSSQSEQKQKNQEGQWLKLIEDDPAGLLKQKFLRDYQRAVDEGKA